LFVGLCVFAVIAAAVQAVARDWKDIIVTAGE